MSRVGAALQAIAKIAIPILRSALTKTLPRAIGAAITALDHITSVIQTLVSWIQAAVSQVHSLGEAINGLPALPDLNKGLLGQIGIDPNKGLVGQLPGLGGHAVVASTANTRPLQANLYLDGKLVYQSMVNQDKIARRQTGRSLLANA